MIKAYLTFIILGILVIQMILGVFSRIFMFARTYTQSHQIIKQIHKWMGYAIILLVRVIISIYFIEENNKNPGEKTTESERMKAWFFVLGALYFILIIFEFLYRSLIPIFVKKRIEKSMNTIPP